jgi:hypothetical protein
MQPGAHLGFGKDVNHQEAAPHRQPLDPGEHAGALKQCHCNEIILGP